MGNMKLFLALIGIFLLCGAVNVADEMYQWGVLPWHVITAQPQSAEKIISKTYDADNAIYNYEWFKSQYQNIQATEKNIQNTKEQIDQFKADNGNMSTWDYQTKETYQQMQTTYRGQQQFYNNQVADYEARSSMANRAIFKDGLPAQIDKKLWI